MGTQRYCSHNNKTTCNVEKVLNYFSDIHLNNHAASGERTARVVSELAVLPVRTKAT
jgi:hypothetical protein